MGEARSAERASGRISSAERAAAKVAKAEAKAAQQATNKAETAAKRGRPAFNQMVRRLKAGEAVGVIVHKVDRSARNFWDWALLNDLLDQGIDVRLSVHACPG